MILIYIVTRKCVLRSEIRFSFTHLYPISMVEWWLLSASPYIIHVGTHKEDFPCQKSYLVAIFQQFQRYVLCTIISTIGDTRMFSTLLTFSPSVFLFPDNILQGDRDGIPEGYRANSQQQLSGNSMNRAFCWNLLFCAFRVMAIAMTCGKILSVRIISIYALIRKDG